MTPSVGPREAATQVGPPGGGQQAPVNSRPGSAGADARGGPAGPPRVDPRQFDRPGVDPSATTRPIDARSGGPAGVAGRDSRREPAAPTRAPAAPPRQRVRRARLRAVRLDPWSVMKTAFLLSIAFAIVTLVAVTIVWQVLDASGVYDSINRTVADVLGSAQTRPFDIEEYIGLRKVLGITSLLAVVNVVLITAIATLGAFLYNLSASLLGGVEMTLAEDE